MREIMAYEASDGEKFFSKAACMVWEQQLAVVELALGGLKPRPNLLPGTYVQQEVAQVWAARIAIIKAAPLPTDQKAPAIAKCEDKTLPNHANVGMFLDGKDPICRAWRRLDCIDRDGKEWDQVYFALHPSEGRGEHAAA